VQHHGDQPGRTKWGGATFSIFRCIEAKPFGVLLRNQGDHTAQKGFLSFAPISAEVITGSMETRDLAAHLSKEGQSLRSCQSSIKKPLYGGKKKPLPKEGRSR
jgi:hypothetical protein